MEPSFFKYEKGGELKKEKRSDCVVHGSAYDGVKGRALYNETILREAREGRGASQGTKVGAK